MKNYKQFLIEMSVMDAQKVLDIGTNYDEKTLKSAFRKMSSKHHPDKGGSTEMMQKINRAYEVLKDRVGKQSDTDEYSNRMKEWRDLASSIANDLKREFKPDVYTSYFESVFGEEFNAITTRFYPDEAEIKRLEGMTHRPSAPHHVTIEHEFSNTDRTKVLELSIYVDVRTAYNNKGSLGSSSTTWSMGISTFAYINGRKVKITRHDYDRSSSKQVFTKPQTVFPKAKINRNKKTKFKKSDMESALTRELNVERSQDYYFLSLSNDKFLALTRGTFRRQGHWSLNGIWERKGKYSWTRDKSTDFKYYTFDETEDTLNIFRKLKGMNYKKVTSYIEREYKRIQS